MISNILDVPNENIAPPEPDSTTNLVEAPENPAQQNYQTLEIAEFCSGQLKHNMCFFKDCCKKL